MFPLLLDKRGAGIDDGEGGGATVPWYLAGGVPLANCKGAYQAEGAASLPDSYINLADPGVNDLSAPVAAPAWDATDGWNFNGSTQYLNTGLVPASGWSALVKFTGVISNVYPFGANTGGSTNFAIGPRINADTRYLNGAILTVVGGAYTSGVAGIAGQQGYQDGVAHGGAIGAWSGVATRSVLIGAYDANGTIIYYSPYIQAFAMYDIALTPAQVLAISDRMAALPL